MSFTKITIYISCSLHHVCVGTCFMHTNLCESHCFVMETVALAVANPDEYVSKWFVQSLSLFTDLRTEGNQYRDGMNDTTCH